jgi:hypothetical protein
MLKTLFFSGSLIMLTFACLPAKGMSLTTIYDGTSGVTPDQASPKYLNITNPSDQSYNSTSKSTVLNSLGTVQDIAGYDNYNVKTDPNSPSVVVPTGLVNPAFPVLSEQAGYSISFTAKINQQSGTPTPTDAGFSLIAISSDRQGVYLNFQNYAGQSSSVNSLDSTLSGVSQKRNINLTSPSIFTLSVLDGSYMLSQNGLPVLFGDTKAFTYTGISSAMLSAPNEFAIGDFSATSGGNTAISNISILNNLDVPEPSQYLGGFLALGLAGIVRKKVK